MRRPGGARRLGRRCGADSTAWRPTFAVVELGAIRRGAMDQGARRALADVPDADEVVLPGSPDGRDLAPRLAAALGRQLLAGATTVTPAVVYVARGGGLELHQIRPDGPFVATLQPGVRGTEPFPGEPVVADCPADFTIEEPDASTSDAMVVDVLPPDVRTMDLAEARRIVGGGAGLDSAERFAQLADVRPARIGGVMGATRVITDRGWVEPRPPDRHHRRGRRPDAVRGVRGERRGAAHQRARRPDHIISVNTDPHCPMMAMSDLADRRATPTRRSIDLLDLAHRRTGPPRSGAYRRERRRRRRRGRRRTGRVVRRHRARPGGPLRRARSSAGAFPGSEEHVRRRRVPADPRPAPPRVVGRGAGATVDHPPLDHDPHRRPGAHGRLPRRGRGAGRRTTVPPPTAPTGTTGWPARPRPTVPTWCARPPSPGCCATNAASWSASPPTVPTATSPPGS